MNDPNEPKYWTIRDIERLARQGTGNTFKGRANEIIIQICKDFGIPVERAKRTSKRQVAEYFFTEDEARLFAALLRVKSVHPISHGNKKLSNVQIADLEKYHEALLAEITQLPERLRTQLQGDLRYDNAVEIQERLPRIRALIDKLEVLFYLAPPDLSAGILRVAEYQLKELLEVAFQDIADRRKSDAADYVANRGTSDLIDNEELLKGHVKRSVRSDLKSIELATDPHVHFLDHLIADYIRISLESRFNKKNRKLVKHAIIEAHPKDH